MIRRTSQDSAPEASAPKPGGKGRPTPSRKEAQAAAKERARASIDKKAAAKASRAKRAAEAAKYREGAARGDDRYLPARDQGPVKAFIRDFIDSRIAFLEFVLPLLLIIMAMTWSGNQTLISFANGLWLATILLAVIDTFLFIRRLKKALRARFPDQDLRGTTSYAMLRVLQVRFLRMPKPRVGLGGKPKVTKK